MVTWTLTLTPTLTGIDIPTLMATWTEKTGYPIVRCTEESSAHDTATLSLRQVHSHSHSVTQTHTHTHTHTHTPSQEKRPRNPSPNLNPNPKL